MVLVQVAEAIKDFPDTTILAAGYCDGQADGGSYGDGCPWSLDWLRRLTARS